MASAEGTSLEAMWQCVTSAHLKWAAEIEVRMGVEIRVSLAHTHHVFANGRITGDLAEQARDEMWQCENHIENLLASITLLQGDPIKKHRQYREAADLYSCTPLQALVDTGLYCIEAVLIGPDLRAAEMLSAEPRLYAAARDRVLHSHDLDGFTPDVRALLAQADSILAAKAIDRALKGSA